MSVHRGDYTVFPSADSDRMLGGFTLPEVFGATVSANPDAVAITDGDRSRTWRQWKTEVDALARGLQELGVEAGDVVAVQLPNCWEFVTLHIAIATVGAVMMPIHRGNGSTDVLALLTRVEPVVVVLPPNTQDHNDPLVGRALLAAVPSLRVVLVAGEVTEEPGVLSVDRLLATWMGNDPRPVDVRPDMPFVLLPSSGTTSARPKICLHTHDGLLSNMSTVVAEDADSFSDAIIAACPLSHLFGLETVHASLFTGCRQVLLNSWDPDRFLELARKEHPSVIFAVPTQLHDIVARLEKTNQAAGFHPRAVWTAGAAIPGALVLAVRAALATSVVVVWGMSEIGTGTCTRADDPADVAARSVGRPTTGARVRIVDEHGIACPAGEVGELQYQSPSMFRGYFREQELTHAAVTADGWLRTGDHASLDDDGLLIFHGRAADLINVGGKKLNATEIQGLLAEMPGIGALAVVGKPDARLGEYPCLVVTRHAQGAINLTKVTEFLRNRGIADYKIPLELIIADDLPRTPAGKLHRRALETMLETTAISPGSVGGDAPASPPRTFDEALHLVRTCVTNLLDLDTKDTIAPEATFRSYGLDSSFAIRLRNMLVEATGLPLPTSLAFDFPSPAAVARSLVGQVDEEDDGLPSPGADATEPVAIVGMACRLPGGVVSPDDLWTLIASETDAISGFPVDRGWDLDRLFDADPEHVGTSYVREGGFLHDASHFDAGFFGFSEREALATDPQQRLLLEAAWEVFERAEIDPTTLRGRRVGVFTGAMYHDYAANSTVGSGELEGLLGIGTAGSAMSGRISYTFGFEGPALTVDTACSSSLVALHLACQSLRSGESSLAMAGGAAIMATPTSFVEFSRLRGLSPDGRCKSFADAADGAAWSEGVGLLLLERLSDARRNGHRVLAVVRGSAVNSDGASNGLTAPNGFAQRRVIRQALANAGLSPTDVDVVEAHGTGTTLGDPIEAQAVLATYGQARPNGQPLWLGSVKSNIGHAQAAAGVAGLIKMVLAMQHGVLPRTLHVDAPSSHVDWSAGSVRLLTAARPWPQETGKTRRAGVSSFGISGTNAHVILEEAPLEDVAEPANPACDAVVPWVLSARSEPALRAQARRLAEHLTANPQLSTQDIAYSLATTRALHDYRAAVVGSDRAELMSAVTELGREQSSQIIVREQAGRRKLAFVFTGQGSQRLGMGRGLSGAFPVFDAALREVCAVLDPMLDRPLTSVMWAQPDSEAAGLLNNTGYAQPALFAIEIALYRLFESCGVVPDYLVGHSIGEIAAAHVSGVLTLQDACALVAARSRLMQALPSRGTMVAARGAEHEVAPWLDDLTETVSIAAVNGPRSIVLSGAETPLTELAGKLGAAGYKTKRLAVSHAFHSPLMTPMLADFRDAISALSFAAPSIPLISNLTGRPLTEEEARDPGYWVRHVREPVRFMDAIDYLRSERTSAFLELGPDAALTPMIYECLESAAQQPVPTVVSTLRGEHDEERATLAAIAQLHNHGVPVEWTAVLPEARPVPLPTYPFQHQEYWLTAAWTIAGSNGILADPEFQERPSLATKLSGLRDLEQDEILLGVILAEVAAVLGGNAPESADATQPFVEMGINSVNAIELRNRLTAATGVRLPATLVFDYPTPAAIARLVRQGLERFTASSPRDAAEIVYELESLLSAGATVDADTTARLKAIATRWDAASTAASGGLDIDAATDEELFRLMDSSSWPERTGEERVRTAVRRTTLGALIDDAEQTFQRAGIVTPRADAQQVAAHVLGMELGKLALDSEPDDQLVVRFRQLVDSRAERIPLGHLTGVAVLGGVEVSVGPGVFVPRVHSELVLASGLRAIRDIADPVVVDLCTGSGAIALAVAHARPDATVHAVDFDPLALEFARRNRARQVELGDTAIVLHDADVARPGLLAELDGTVDLVLANPPFMPEKTELPPEFGVHQPKQAIFSGPDGLHVIRHVVDAAARLLRPHGGFVVEHGHLHGETVPRLLRADTRLQGVASYLDHDQLPLYSTATRG